MNTTTESQERSRAEFEAWARSQNLDMDAIDGGYMSLITETAWITWQAAHARAGLAAMAGQEEGTGVMDAPQFYTCIGKGGKYRLLGTATGAGTSKDMEDLRIYIEADNPLAMYYRTIPNFDLRMAVASDIAAATPEQSDTTKEKANG